MLDPLKLSLHDAGNICSDISPRNFCSIGVLQYIVTVKDIIGTYRRRDDKFRTIFYILFTDRVLLHLKF